MNIEFNTWTSEQVDRMNKKNVIIEMFDMLSISFSSLSLDNDMEKIKHKLALVETSMGVSISRF